MKVCTRCKEEKELRFFYLRSGSTTHSWCKSCVNEDTKLRQRKLKIECISYKGGKCERCGIIGHPSIFDFHHKDPEEKDFMISRVRSLKFSEKHTKELDKCELLCSNCHRVEHSVY